MFRRCVSSGESADLDRRSLSSPDVGSPRTLVRQHICRPDLGTRSNRYIIDDPPASPPRGSSTRFSKGTTGLLWLRSCVPCAHHGHHLAASSSPADVHRSYFRTVLTLVLVKRPVGRLLLGFRRWSRWHFPVKRATTPRLLLLLLRLLLLLLLRLLSKKLVRAVRRLVGDLGRPFSRALGRGSVERAACQYVRGASLYGAVMGARGARKGPVPHRGQWFGALVQRQHRTTVRGRP